MRIGLPLPDRQPSQRLLTTAIPTDPSVGRFGVVYTILLVAANIGYPIFGLLTTVLMPGETTINYTFRLLVVGLSAVVIIHSFLFMRQRQVSLIIVLFFILYGYRLYYDTLISYLPDSDIASYYFVGTVLAPVLAIGLGARLFDDRRYAFWAFVISGVESMAILLVTTFAPNTVGAATEEQGRLSFDALNPITIGYTGVMTVLSAVYLWPRSSIPVRIGLAAMIAIGSYVVVLSGSRGPLVAVILCLTFLAAVRGKVALLAFGGLAGFYAAIIAADRDLSIVARFAGVGSADDQSSAERLNVMQLAIDEARAQPVFGHAYVETTLMAYPHNLLVESALAIGVTGLLLMLTIQFLMARAAWRLGRRGYTFVAMIILMALINANLSASLWQSTDFWTGAMLALILPPIINRRDLAKQTEQVTGISPVLAAR